MMMFTSLQRGWQLCLGGLLLLAMALVAPAAHACTYMSGSSLGTATFTVPATLTIPRDVPLNTVIYSQSTTGPAETIINCNGSGYPSGIKNNLGPTPSSGNLMPITQSGVATGLSWQFTRGTGTNINTWSEPGYPGTEFIRATALNYQGGGVFSVRLVVTGPLAPNINLSGYAGQYLYEGLPVYNIYFSGTVHVVTGACTLNVSDVSLGSHTSQEMPNIGSTTTSVPVPISLTNCPSSLKTISYTMAPVYGTVATNVAALNGTGATGVGVQLLDSSGAVLPLNSAQSMAATGATTYNINLKARYYRTGAITAGAANTSMTVTMVYN